MKTEELFAIRVNGEHDAETFWDALRERYPVLNRSLERNGCAVISHAVWLAIADLPGFDAGSECAETALIDCGSRGDQ